MCVRSQLEAVSNVRTLMTGIPRAIREHRYLVMLKCYIDDSGSDIQEHGVFVLAGYLMEETRWEDFAERWFVQLNRDFSIDYCKMTEAESGEGQFLGREDIFRKRKVKDLAEVIRNCNPTALACRMHWSDYNAIFKEKSESPLSNPYAILFFQLLKVSPNYRSCSTRLLLSALSLSISFSMIRESMELGVSSGMPCCAKIYLNLT